MASLYIKDDETNALAQALATERGLTKTAAVKLALVEALSKIDRRTTREKMREYRTLHPLPEMLGPVPDKAFYDALSDGL